MTAKQLAEKMNGREYLKEITVDEEREAKNSGLVAVYGYSDDNVELVGAIDDEIGCFESATILLTPDGVVKTPDCDCEAVDCPYFKRAVETAKTIKALWCAPGSEAGWSFVTEIPHETFNIYEDGELFCVGIVFRKEDLE